MKNLTKTTGNLSSTISTSLWEMDLKLLPFGFSDFQNSLNFYHLNFRKSLISDLNRIFNNKIRFLKLISLFTFFFILDKYFRTLILPVNIS
jgi:hypothetical protein